jgi:pentatricopeptide repeat protein
MSATTTPVVSSSNEELHGEGGDHEEVAIPLVRDEETWQLYVQLMTDVMQRDRVIGKKLSVQEIQAVQEYLLQNCALADLPSPPTLSSCSDDASNTKHGGLYRVTCRDRIEEQRRVFLQQSNLTVPAHDYLGRCLVYMADFCAKKQHPGPCLPAWYKLRECGLAPRENAVSTYLYVLSIDDDPAAVAMGSAAADNSLHRQQREACLDVAVFHDMLYKPSEKTITLRIKALISKGEAAAAEQILAFLPDKKGDTTVDGDESLSSWKRLRTYVPILQHYCDTGDVMSALRLYREMRQSDGVYLGAETYAMVIAAAARHGWFRRPLEQPETVKSLDLGQYGFSVPSGPALFDELATDMADDILEIDESSANTITEGFEKGFGMEPTGNENRLFIGRVSVNDTTAVCPASGAKLRLFTLPEEQRRNVHNTLLQMAASQHEEYGEKLFARRQGKSGNNKSNSTLQARDGKYAFTELYRFSDWLRLRDGDAFTAFIDGPNIAYYGHGDVHWSQVQLVVDKLEQMGETPLVIMPQKYVASKFWLSSVGFTQELSEHELAIMNQLVDSKKMYVVPTACLDDYYWMLSSVAEQKPNQRLHVAADNESGRFLGVRPILVTNDQMRDHRLSLLQPRLFRRWTSCHIVNYDIKTYEKNEWEERQVDLFPADFFSREIQSNTAAHFDESTAWHFPVSEWPEPDRLCVTIIR